MSPSEPRLPSSVDGFYLPPRIFGPHSHVRAWATQDFSAPAGEVEPPAQRMRTRQFDAGRRCAARALEEAGSADVHVGVGEHGAPRWPPGYVGSIAHSKTIAWAAVASTRYLQSLGIDCEPVFDDAAMSDVVPLVMLEPERRCADGCALSPCEIATFVFSAKESLYKCLHPRVQTFFDFTDALVERVTPSGTFRVRLLRDLGGGFARGAELGGRYAFEGGHVHTAIELGTGESAAAKL